MRRCTALQPKLANQLLARTAALCTYRKRSIRVAMLHELCTPPCKGVTEGLHLRQGGGCGRPAWAASARMGAQNAPELLAFLRWLAAGDSVCTVPKLAFAKTAGASVDPTNHPRRDAANDNSPD